MKKDYNVYSIIDLTSNGVGLENILLAIFPYKTFTYVKGDPYNLKSDDFNFTLESVGDTTYDTIIYIDDNFEVTDKSWEFIYTIDTSGGDGVYIPKMSAIQYRNLLDIMDKHKLENTQDSALVLEPLISGNKDSYMWRVEINMPLDD